MVILAKLQSPSFDTPSCVQYLLSMKISVLKLVRADRMRLAGMRWPVDVDVTHPLCPFSFSEAALHKDWK